MSTKLFIPRPRPRIVSRHRLTEQLNARLDRKLTLMAAPAGFGKTTLLSEWIPQSPRCVTWLSLDEADNDPTRFWTYFISSVQRLQTNLGENALTLLQSPQAPPANSILTALINAISEFPDVFAIVLDDYHVIESQSIHAALAFLTDHLPVNMHLVITSRVDPPLPLARLRVQDQLTEIRANDLRFTPDETREFINQVMGLELSDGEIATLEERAEGWIAGLQIAALSMQGHEDIPDFIRTFSGSHRHILGYLAEEVLNQQPEDTLKFLMKTSILDRLSGALCDALAGGSNGQEVLESLEQANLFIAKLDEEGKWYRYHPLFAEVLQARLSQMYAGKVSELHRRAGNWFASQGMTSEAVHHALAGADFDQAAHLIERVAGEILRRGASTSLIRWLDVMPEEIVRAHPHLCLARGWSFLWGPEFSLEKAEAWALHAQQGMTSSMDNETETEGELYALKTLIAADRVDLPLTREFSQRALECLPAGNPWRVVTTFCLGTVLFAAGELTVAASALKESLEISQESGALYIQLITATFLADIQVVQGHLDRAKEMYEQVLTWGNQGIPHKGVLLAHAGLANVLCEQNDPTAALDHVHKGLEQLEQVGGPGTALWLYRTLARIQQAKGNWPGALEALDQIYIRGHKAQIAFVTTQASALRARLNLVQGNLEEAAAWAADSGLDPDDPQATRSGLHEMEFLTHARLFNAEGRKTEALSLLDQLLVSAEMGERTGSVIEILALQSIAYRSQGNMDRALECLERALTLVEPGGYIRLFVEEGNPMRLLLNDYQTIIKNKLSVGTDITSLRLLTTIDKLLASFPRADAEKLKGEIIHDPLSERELDILRLIATGRTNQEIAEILVIAVSTVKSHINHLYSKLDTNRRTQAIAIARDMGLLSD